MRTPALVPRTGMVCGRGSGRSQLKSVSGADRARLCECGHVNFSILNSADYLPTCNIPIGRYGAGPSLQALLSAGSVLVYPCIQYI